MRLQFLVQRFPEQQNVGLGCSVCCIAWHGLISQKTGGQENVTAPAFHHVACEEVGEFSHRDHIQLQHVSDLFKGLIEKGAVKAVASIVHQNLNADAPSIDAGLEISPDPCLRQVHAFYYDLDGMHLPKLLCQPLHGLGAACDQHDIRLPLC